MGILVMVLLGIVAWSLWSIGSSIYENIGPTGILFLVCAICVIVVGYFYVKLFVWAESYISGNKEKKNAEDN